MEKSPSPNAWLLENVRSIKLVNHKYCVYAINIILHTLGSLHSQRIYDQKFVSSVTVKYLYNYNSCVAIVFRDITPNPRSKKSTSS